MENTLYLFGAVNGTQVLVPVSLPEGAQDVGQRVAQASAFWSTQGVTVGGYSTAQAPLRERLEGPAQQVAAPAPAQTGAWVCPVHGGQRVEPDKKYGYLRCGVSSQFQPEWSHRAWTNRDGKTVYFCDKAAK